MKRVLKKRWLIDMLFLIVVAIVVCIPLFNSHVNVYNEEGMETFGKAYGTYTSIKKNGFFSKSIITSFANNFGYSFELFSGNLSTYLLILGFLATNNWIITYKILSCLVIFLSGFFMYRFVKNFSKNTDIALLAGILYMIFPYHLSTLYMRNNFEELLTFVFLPICFLGIFEILNGKKTYAFVLGMCILSFTNNVIFCATSVCIAIILIAFFDKTKRKDVRRVLLMDILFIILITSICWIPKIETISSGSFYVEKIAKEKILNDKTNIGLRFLQIFVSPDGSYSLWEIGLNMIIMLAFSYFAYKNMEPSKFKKSYTIFLLLGIVSTFLSTRYFIWKFLPKTFLFLKPWQLSEFTGFFFCIISSINMYVVIKKFNFKDVIIISCISILYMAFFVKFIPYSDSIKNISEYELGHISGKEDEYVSGIRILILFTREC